MLKLDGGRGRIRFLNPQNVGMAQPRRQNGDEEKKKNQSRTADWDVSSMRSRALRNSSP